jgi:hypothetical protein
MDITPRAHHTTLRTAKEEPRTKELRLQEFAHCVLEVLSGVEGRLGLANQRMVLEDASNGLSGVFSSCMPKTPFRLMVYHTNEFNWHFST